MTQKTNKITTRTRKPYNVYIVATMVMVGICFVILLFYQNKKQTPKQQKTLWSHIVYTEIKRNHLNNQIERKTTLSHGLFNQLNSLFHAVDIATILKRDLIIGNFYVNYTDTHTSVPLSKIIDLKTLNVPCSDLETFRHMDPTPSEIAEHTYDLPPTTFEILMKEHDIDHLEIGCLFNLLMPDPETNSHHLQVLRFHSIFYDLTSSLLSQYPKYQVVHYRIEDDYAGYFHNHFGFGSARECQENLFKQYKEAIHNRFNPDIPVLVVSHYYKDRNDPWEFDIPGNNIIHGPVRKEYEQQLTQHLGLNPDTPMREVEAVVDFVLSTSPNVCGFIGIEMSSFSESIVAFLNNTNCFLIKPQKQ